MGIYFILNCVLNTTTVCHLPPCDLNIPVVLMILIIFAFDSIVTKSAHTVNAFFGPNPIV